MEQNVITRKVVIINSKTQSQKVIQDSHATTLGELKAEAREKGIDFSGMTWFEGHMRAELKDDAAPLPTNIPYKGQVVNDLTFMLTAPEKKVRSGAMSRAEAYAEIKKRGLQGACVDKFGRNFTQCSTAALISLIENNIVMPAAPKAEKPRDIEPIDTAPAKKEEAPATPKAVFEPQYSAFPEVGNASKALAALVEDLYASDIIEEETYGRVTTILSGDSCSAPEKMSKKEVDEMFNFVDR